MTIVKKLLRLVHICLTAFVVLLVMWFSISWLIYRLTANEPPIKITAEVEYKMLELELSNRSFFEETALSHFRPIRLVGHNRFYISEAEHAQLWQASPFDMLEQNYTIVATIEVQPLVFGGYSAANLISYEKVQGTPHVTK